MKRTAKLFGIVAIAMVLFFAMTGNATADDAAITITVTGDFSDYLGYRAYMAVGDDTYTMPLNVRGSTSSLQFTLLRHDNDQPFTQAGSYMVILWFRLGDDKSTDVDYIIMSRQIREGDNSIPFSSFSEL